MNTILKQTFCLLALLVILATGCNTKNERPFENTNVFQVSDEPDNINEPEPEQGSYPTQNGNIIERKIENNAEITIRRHEQQIITYLFREFTLSVYNEPYKNSNIIYIIEEDELIVYTSQILTKIYPNIKENEVWLKVLVAGNQGWIDLTNQYYDNPAKADPYWNNNGMVSEVFIVNGRTWTSLISGFNPVFYVLTADARLNVRNKPGQVGSEIIFQLNFYDEVEVLEITLEKETIGDRTSNWMKIKDTNGRIGWVFGGFIGFEAGGGWWEQLPENRVGMRFAFYT